MVEGRRQLRVVFVGRADESLQSLLEDLLEVQLVEGGRTPELVLAIVGPRDPFRVLAAAQAVAAQRVPIIAILPIGDDRLSRRALLAGAQFCWPLDGSLRSLRSALLGVLSVA